MGLPLLHTLHVRRLNENTFGRGSKLLGTSAIQGRDCPYVVVRKRHCGGHAQDHLRMCSGQHLPNMESGSHLTTEPLVAVYHESELLVSTRKPGSVDAMAHWRVPRLEDPWALPHNAMYASTCVLASIRFCLQVAFFQIFSSFWDDFAP